MWPTGVIERIRELFVFSSQEESEKPVGHA